MKFKKALSMILVVAMLSALLAGCSSKNTETKPDNKDTTTPTTTEQKDPTKVSEEEKQGGVLNIALASSPKNLDPILYTGVYESQIIGTVGQTLVSYNQDLSQIIPCLATEWTPSEDGTSYTFKLRDDVYFQKGKYQDGKQMKAEDVKYSLERSAFDSALNRLTMLKSVEVLGDFEIKCNLGTPNAAFLTALTDAGNIIVPKEEVEGWGSAFGSNLVGTGPFALKEFKLDQESVLIRNENYWGEKPYLEGVTFKVITDPNQRTNALRTGEIDVSTDVVGESVKIIKEDPNLVLKQVPGLHIAYVYMNLHEGKPTANPKVREAIIKAIDVEEMVKGIYQYDEAQRAYIPLPPGSWGYDASLEKTIPTYDPEAAKALLAEAGYPNGLSLELYISNTPSRVKMATILQAYLKQNLNIDLQVKTVEWGTFSEIGSSGQADMFGMSWTWYPDPYFFLNKMFHSSEIGALGNGQGYNNPEVDKLLDDALKETDLEVRKELYSKALKIITESNSQLVYSNEKVTYGLNPSVQGFELRADQKIIVSGEGINVWKMK